MSQSIVLINMKKVSEIIFEIYGKYVKSLGEFIKGCWTNISPTPVIGWRM